VNRPLRIFLGAFGQPGHAFPMLALGAELARRGHTVMYETWTHWANDVAAAGMHFSPAPEYPVFPTREQPLQPYEVVFRAAGETRERMQQFGADLVVHDILTLAPALAGELEGLPVATLIPHLYPVPAPGLPPYAVGARLPRTAAGARFWNWTAHAVESGLALGREQLNHTRGRLGLPARAELHGGLSRELCLVATFPQLEYPRPWPASVHVVGPLLWEPETPRVAVPAGPGPLVLIAPSTAQDPSQRMLHAALAGLARTQRTPRRARAEGSGAPLRVLATTNRRPLSRPVALGPGIELVNWLSYAQTMPAADLVVCHAGHGTLVRALASGTPVVAIPHVGDMGENAARVDWAGAGVRLPWRLLSPLTLRLAVARALDPGLGLSARAGEFRAWAAEHDGAARAAELVAALSGHPSTLEPH
jgi:UDP:flavonoid glycosyltransferase YjiC (YdhE family)